MKRIVMTFVMLLTVLAMNAQKQNLKGFVSTGQNVNVRKGPGMKYPVIDSEWGKIQLDKDEVVADNGKMKNGFRYVTVTQVIFGSVINIYEGWVSAKYLKPVNRCPECLGMRYTGEIEDLEQCEICKGKGFVR